MICVCLAFAMSLGLVACAKETTTMNKNVDNESSSVTEENSVTLESSSATEDNNKMKYLYDCKIITEWKNVEIASSKTDSFGNIRKNCIVVEDNETISSNAMYDLEDSYLTLTGTIVCSENIKDGEKGRVDIYANLVKIYSSPIISADTEAIDISVDVSKAGNLIIEVVSIGDEEASEYGFSVILSDFVLN